MTSINFALRPSCKQGRYPGSLYLRVIHNRKVKTITMKKCRLYPEEWDPERQMVIYPENDPVRIACLKQVEHTIVKEKNLLEDYLQALEKQGYYTIDNLMIYYRQRKDENKLSGYTESLALALESHGQYRTARAYRTVCRGIISFNNGNDIPLNQINTSLIKGFETYLKDKGRLPNTISCATCAPSTTKQLQINNL